MLAIGLGACSSGDGSFRGRSDGNDGTPDAAVVTLPDASPLDLDARGDAGAATDADTDANFTTAFFLDWTIEDVGPPINDVVLCEEAGTNTLAVAATNTSTGFRKDFLFPCSAQKGVQLPLPPGPYSLAVRLLRGDNVEVSSIVIPLSLAPTGVTDIGGIVFEIQSFSARWSIARAAAPNTPVTCASVGATAVELTATTKDLPPFVFRFACVDGTGLTQAVPDGDYALQYRLLNAAGAALSQLNPANYSTPVGTPAVLAPVTFTVN